MIACPSRILESKKESLQTLQEKGLVAPSWSRCAAWYQPQRFHLQGPARAAEFLVQNLLQGRAGLLLLQVRQVQLLQAVGAAPSVIAGAGPCRRRHWVQQWLSVVVVHLQRATLSLNDPLLQGAAKRPLYLQQLAMHRSRERHGETTSLGLRRRLLAQL